MMFTEGKPEYVARRVEAFRKDYRRTHELEGTRIDPTEFEYLTLEVKHEAEDCYDLWHPRTRPS